MKSDLPGGTSGEPETGMSTAAAILHQVCPKCRRGRMFPRSILSGFPKMHEHCPVCGLKFEREQGYFLGAMYISYALALLAITGIGVILWFATSWSLQKVFVCAVVLFLPIAPALTLFSRVLWMYLDWFIDPE